MSFKVLTYVGGKLTVINGDYSVLGIEADAPSFVAEGTALYYEPTLKHVVLSDGRTRELTAQEVSSAEAFIDGYIFPENVTPQPAPDLRVHAVNDLGAYLGFKLLEDGEVGVPTAPEVLGKYYYDFTSKTWILGYTVDAETGVLSGLGVFSTADVSGTAGVAYIPASLVDAELCTACQTYDFATKKIVFNLKTMRETKSKEMYSDMGDELLATIGDFNIVGAYEIPSYPFQLQEAQAFQADANASTPFIDALLAARSFSGETKSNLVSKILAKSADYKSYYGSVLGKFHNRIKAIADATTVSEIKAIVW